MLANELSGDHIGMYVTGPFGQSRKRKRKNVNASEKTRTIHVSQVYQSENLVLVNGKGNYLRPTDEVEVFEREEDIPEVPEVPDLPEPETL
jgi:hypothetical protein